jgi:dipeptidase
MAASKAAAVSVEITTPATEVATPAKLATAELPQFVEFTEPTLTAIHKLTALIRSGYIPLDIVSYGPAWGMTVTLTLGDPDKAIVEAAAVDIETARAKQAYDREKEIAAAAERLVQERDRAAREAAKQAEIKAAEAALAALKKAAAAQIATL